MTEDRVQGGPDRQPTEGGEGTAEVEGFEETAPDGESPAGGEQKETERTDEL